MKLRVKFIGKSGERYIVWSDLDILIPEDIQNPFCYVEETVKEMLSKVTFEITSIKEVG